MREEDGGVFGGEFRTRVFRRGDPPPTAVDFSASAKVVAKKRRFAAEGRFLTGAPDPERRRRVPPGQSVVKTWPVLDLGHQPAVDKPDWSLTVGGWVERPLQWRWDDLATRATDEALSDIHCVTAWSRLDNRWRGLAFRTLMDWVRPRAEARFAVVKSYDGYATNLPIADLAAPGAMLATHWEGAPLTREHGAPARLIVPHLYFWKSAKWVRHIWFVDRDAPGYWERLGYHPRGDPWREQRYGGP